MTVSSKVGFFFCCFLLFEYILRWPVVCVLTCAFGLQISQLWCCHQRQGCFFFFVGTAVFVQLHREADRISGLS